MTDYDINTFQKVWKNSWRL